MIPAVVITTRRIEIVSNAVRGRPRKVVAALTIALLIAVATGGVTAARSIGSTAAMRVENTTPAKPPIAAEVIVPGDGVTSTIVVATAVIVRDGTIVKT